MNGELKPCPFCGSHDVQIVQFSLMYSPENELVDVRPGLQIECSKCHLACLNYMLDQNANLELERDELIRAWNKRSVGIKDLITGEDTGLSPEDILKMVQQQLARLLSQNSQITQQSQLLYQEIRSCQGLIEQLRTY